MGIEKKERPEGLNLWDDIFTESQPEQEDLRPPIKEGRTPDPIEEFLNGNLESESKEEMPHPESNESEFQIPQAEEASPVNAPEKPEEQLQASPKREETPRAPVRAKGRVRPIKKRLSGKALDMLIESKLQEEIGVAPAQSSVAWGILVFIETGQVIDLIQPYNIMGSSNTFANILISGNATVSRKHAAIFTEHGRYYIQDLESMNGTTVNGRRLDKGEELELTGGEQIVISNVVFQFLVEKG